MDVDWFTVVAQIFNFLILVWLMNRFLYKPIHNAIETREKRIETELADADTKKAEAQVERNAFQKKNEAFDRQYAENLRKATAEVKTERERLLDAAQKEVDKRSAKLQEVMVSDAHNLNKSIRLRTQKEVFAIARKALSDLATTDLEERVVDVFIRRLQEMDDKAKEVLSKALKTATELAILSTAFDLTEEQRNSIQNAINKYSETEIHMRFVTVPDLISGIAFSSNGYKIEWNIADYLLSMEKGVSELIKAKDKFETKSETKSIETTSEKGAGHYGN